LMECDKNWGVVPAKILARVTASAMTEVGAKASRRAAGGKGAKLRRVMVIGRSSFFSCVKSFEVRPFLVKSKKVRGMGYAFHRAHRERSN
jgi:hypothetical protein